MKRSLLIMFGLTLFSLPTILHAETGTIVAGSVFIREAPGKGSRIVGSFIKGDTVEYSPLPDNPTWVKVKGKGKEGVMIRKAIAGGKTKPVAKVSTKGANATVTLQLMAPSPEMEACGGPGGEACGDVEVKTTKNEKKQDVFEIITEATPEEIRLQGENGKLSEQVKVLEAQVRELLPLKEEMAKLQQEIGTKQKELDRIHSMFPYLSIIETVEGKGEDVVLTGIGKAKMATANGKVIIRLENTDIAKGDKAMQRVTKEKYQTGSGDTTRAYYVLNDKAIKHVN